MVNYKNGKIYKVVCNGLTYFGSTCKERLSNRFSSHKSSYNKWVFENKPRIKYCTIFNLFEEGNPEIILCELFPCESKDELFARERYYIENNECVNRNKPGRTDEEREIERRKDPERKRYMKEFNQKEIQKEKAVERARKYYQRNKEKINISRKEKVKCDCGCIISRGQLNEHKKSQRHIYNI